MGREFFGNLNFIDSNKLEGWALFTFLKLKKSGFKEIFGVGGVYGYKLSVKLSVVTLRDVRS
jgi:hypothetical protein